MSGYSALMMTVMYGCIQTVWKTTIMTLFVVYVEQYLVKYYPVFGKNMHFDY